MPRLNIAITTVLVLCGIGLLGGLALHQPALLAASVVIGTVAMTCAAVVALVLLAVLLSRSLSGTARPFLERSWLGLVNGAVAVAIWAVSVWRYGS
jgi:hypothetical protein